MELCLLFYKSRIVEIRFLENKMDLELEVYWVDALAKIDGANSIELILGALLFIITLWMFVKGFEVFKMACREMGIAKSSSRDPIGAVPEKGWKEICKVCGSGDGCICNKG